MEYTDRIGPNSVQRGIWNEQNIGALGGSAERPSGTTRDPRRGRTRSPPPAARGPLQPPPSVLSRLRTAAVNYIHALRLLHYPIYWILHRQT